MSRLFASLSRRFGASSSRKPRGPVPALTVISNGLGRDSATMVSLLVEGKLMAGGELIRPEDVDLVVFSDTGYEWSFTYQVIPVMEKMLAGVDVPFFVLHKPPEERWRPFVDNNRRAFLEGWERAGGRGLDASSGIFRTGGPVDRYRSKQKISPPWLEEDFAGLTFREKAARGLYHNRAPIMQQYSMYSRITTRIKPQCTDSHKIQPIERLVKDMLEAKYGMPWSTLKRKDPPPTVRGEIEAGRIGKVRMLIGFAADEGGRVERGKVAVKGAGKTAWKDELYPLVEMGITKADETPILRRHGLDWIRKSGCMICHWQPVDWFWALSVQNPELFARIEAWEAEALVRNPTMFIRGSRPIGETVRRWRAKNPDATIEDVLNKSYERACSFGGSKNQAHLPVFIPA